MTDREFSTERVRVTRVGGQVMARPTAKPLGPRVAQRAQVEAFRSRVAQHEPTEGQHGLMLRYDSTWRSLGLIDTWAAKPEDRFQSLGPIGEAAAKLQYIFGLTPHQADQAISIAVHKFNTDLNLDYLRRVAQARTSSDPLGTATEAFLWADRLEPAERIFALALLSYATGQQPSLPVLQGSMTQDDAGDIALVLSRFGVRIPGFEEEPKAAAVDKAEGIALAAAMELAGEGVPDTDEAMISAGFEVMEAARHLADTVDSGMIEFRFTIGRLAPDERQDVARQLHGMREMMRALDSMVERGFGK